MLAELAAANAAFAVIKTAISNGREITDCAKQIAAFTHAKDDLHQRGTKKKNSFWSKVGGKDGDDLEEFMALEQLKQKEEELKQLMIYCGRPGLHGDWVRFQVEARKRRIQEKKEAEQAREQLIEYLVYGTLAAIGLVIVAFVLFFVLTIMRDKGVI